MSKARKTVVLNVVALSESLIGENTPFISKWLQGAQLAKVRPELPAVTTTAQTSYLTGQKPGVHGIVANGWYFKDLCEVKFWHQSNALVQAPKIWDLAREKFDDFTCANMFCWYNMYSTADVAVTPRPQYPADGRKIPDIWTHPRFLRESLQKDLGQFPLFKFWGPMTDLSSSNWIAAASKQVDDLQDPGLTLIYLPHLDYNLQRHGPGHPSVAKDLQEIDGVVQDLVTFYEKKGAQVVLLSEYGISAADQPVHVNRALREGGFLQVRTEQGHLELLDAGASKAFAVSDHQLAHVYVNDPAVKTEVRQVLERLDGVGEILDKEAQKARGIAHARSGDFVLIASRYAWFSYYYWLNDRNAPDFARTVDIHRKPGYDPVEMFFDPALRAPKLKAAWTLLKRKLGFRALMELTSLHADLIKGSHGRIPEEKGEWPVFITKSLDQEISEEIPATEVFGLIGDHLGADLRSR